jgi:hypothetical protein
MERHRIVPKTVLLVLVIFCFSLPQTTLAITVAGTNPDDPMYTSNFPFSFAGIAKIDLVVPLPSPPNPQGSTTQYHGTGVLLNTPSDPGRYVLTAAHIFYQKNSNTPLNIISTNVTFYGSPTTFQGAQNIIHPNWDGNKLHGNDIAIIKLSSSATGITGYDIHRDNNSGIGQIATIVGYGWKGTGTNGWVYQDPIRTLRWGKNRFDATTGDIYGWPWAYDFDNGQTAHDTFGVQNNLNNLGEGLSEVMIAEGDSGGPSFLGNLIAGVHSAGFRYADGTDVDGVLNASFGEIAIDTRTAFYQIWIDQQIKGQVPQPPSNLRIE